MLSRQNRNNPQNRRKRIFDQKALIYFRMRLGELETDIHALKSAYESGELERDVYVGVCKSIEQVIQEVRAAMAKIETRHHLCFPDSQS